MTIKDGLKNGFAALNKKKINSARVDAEILLLSVLAQSSNKPKSFSNDRSWLYAHNDYEISKSQKNKFYGFIKRRAKFEPVAYITGKKEFYSLSFYVDKNVLIPRPETETLVEEALKEILISASKTPKDKKISIADIGTGSGAIAITIANILKNSGKTENIKIYATDISAEALKIARANAKSLAVKRNIIFRRGDLLKALPKNAKIDFLLANLPYVGNDYYYYREWLKNGSRPSEFHEIKHEPKKSLLAKNNGIEYFEKLFRQAPDYLSTEAKIFLESDPYQIKTTKKLAKKYLPSHKISVIKDLRGLNRVTKIEIRALAAF